jgi:hypothetical protein
MGVPDLDGAGDETELKREWCVVAVGGGFLRAALTSPTHQLSIPQYSRRRKQPPRPPPGNRLPETRSLNGDRGAKQPTPTRPALQAK